ncbi:MAG: sulfatase [Acidobacteria bacterium]|nr:sulfatase [Acidobacteriota bacterium]
MTTIPRAAVCLALVALCACERGRPGPRVALVTFDTTRADHLTPWDSARDTSPGVAALARSGVLFRRAYCNMPTTDPSHASMLTGLYPRRHGITRNGQSAVPGLRTLATRLKESGCATAAFISRKHLDPRELGLAGFDTIDLPDEAERRADETVGLALRWLDGIGPNGFLLWVHLFDPHAPYDPPREFREPGPQGEAPAVRHENWAEPAARYTPQQVAHNVRLYDGEIGYADLWLGKLVAALDALPGEPPLIVLAADHGESLDELQERYGYAFGHGEFLYDGQTHVPLVMRWKGRLPAGRAVDALVELVDLPSTLLELWGLPEPALGNGSSRARLARGETDDGAHAVFVERRSFKEPPRPWLAAEELAVVSGGMKLIASAARGEELYDLEADPHETVNLLESQPDRAAPLRELLAAWRRAHPPLGPGAEADPEKIRELRSLGYVN